MRFLGPGSKRPAGGGDDHALDRRRIRAAQRLKNRVVLAVHRQEPHPGLARRAHEGDAGADQTFLIGERHVAAGLDRRVGRLDAGGADDGANHEIGLARRRLDHGLASGGDLNIGPGQGLLQRRIGALVPNRHEFRPEGQRDPRQGGVVAPAGDRHHHEAFRIALDQI